MKTDIRIVFLGDEGVGKSTIINCIISDTFQEKVMRVVPEVTIPPEVTLDKTHTHIIDTGAGTYEVEIQRADVIVVIYAVDRLDSLISVRTHWMPVIRTQLDLAQRRQEVVPVVLVGNKADVRSDTQHAAAHYNSQDEKQMDEYVQQLMRQFREIETWLECSAKRLLNINEVFFYSQKAVLYPQSVMYDSVEGTLTPLCMDVLERVFRICDLDGDGYLSDFELNEFQRRCFNAPLQQAELDAVKEVVQQSEPNGITEQGMTVAGFQYLNLMFIARGRLETTWSVLRKFGYADNLVLSNDFLHPPLTVQAHQSVELSPAGDNFFRHLFNRYDRDQDGMLNASEMRMLFATAPEQPWGKTFPAYAPTASDNTSVPADAFVAQWWMTTTLDAAEITLPYLAYLGYDSPDTRSALTITRGRQEDMRQQQLTRRAFKVLVFGSKASGKTGLLRSFIGKEFSADTAPTLSTLSVANAVSLAPNVSAAASAGAANGLPSSAVAAATYPNNYYLILQEIPELEQEAVTGSEATIAHCDCALFLYDASNAASLAYAQKLFLRVKQTSITHKLFMPSCIFVRTKTDLLPPKAVPAHPRGHVAHGISVSTSRPTELFDEILTTIVKSHNKDEGSSLVKTVVTGLGVVVVVAGLAYAVKLYLNSKK